MPWPERRCSLWHFRIDLPSLSPRPHQFKKFVVAEWVFALGLRKEVQAAVEARSGPVRLRTGQQAAVHPQ